MKNERTFTETKINIRVLRELGLELDEIKKVFTLLETEEDFEVNEVRFIQENAIDKIQQEELKNKPYILGCFTDWFIADNTDLSLEIIKALQAGEQFEVIGNHIINNGYVEDIQQEYARLDGYGHHFNSYDGNCDEDIRLYDEEGSTVVFYAFVCRVR